MNAYNLSTHLGAYLFRSSHFHPDRLVGFVLTSDSDNVLHGYADASGKYETVTDKILAVNGCLSTPIQWSEFDTEWQSYLERKGFDPDPDTGQYVFHTAEFKTGNCDLMPKNRSRATLEAIYSDLVDLICKHTLYRFGFGMSLPDFRQMEIDYPYGREALFKHPGTYASHECFQWNKAWADRRDRESVIDYMFDQGDEFWGPMFEDYRKERKKIPLKDRTVGNLTEGCRRENSPLQAADVVAWECRTHSLKLQKGYLTGLISPPPMSSALARLLRPLEAADIRFYSRKDYQSSLQDFGRRLLTENNGARMNSMMGRSGEPTPDEIEIYIRQNLDFCQSYDLKAKHKSLNAWKERKGRRNET